MSRKSKRHHKKHKHHIYMSEDDKKVIELLNIQAQAIIIYLIADIFTYSFAIETIQSVYVQYFGGETDSSYENRLLATGAYLSLMASLVISKVSFIAYDNLQNKNINGLFDYSIEGDNEIKIASVYTVILCYLNFIGAAKLYNRPVLCKIQVDEGWMKILNVQLAAHSIRFVADYLTLSETLEGIELVKSKYSESKIDTKHLQNPDAVAIMSAFLYLIQRSMIFYVNCKVYWYTFNACSDVVNHDYFEPNVLPIIGSVFGIIADIIALDGFIKIYRRNVDKPVFGR